MPAQSFTRTERIPRSAADVLAFLRDVRQAEAWMEEVVRVEPVDDGPVRPGWRYRETRRMKGREHSAVIRVTEVTDPDAGPPFAIRHVARGLGNHAACRFVVEPDGPEACRLTLEASVAPVGLLGRPFTGMLLRTIERTDGHLLERLREHLAAPSADRDAAGASGER